MRTLFVAFMALCVLTFVPAQSQPITLHLRQKTLPAVFRQLQQQASCFFNYWTEDVRYIRVDLDVEKEPLLLTLQKLFANLRVSFTVSREGAAYNIVVHRNDSTMLRGIVRDDKGE